MHSTENRNTKTKKDYFKVLKILSEENKDLINLLKSTRSKAQFKTVYKNIVIQHNKYKTL